MQIVTRKARLFASIDDLRRYLRAEQDTDTVGDVTAQPLGDDIGEVPRIEPTEHGWALTVDGETVTAESRSEAFALLEQSTWFGEATGRKNVTAAAFESFAPGRWLDATSVEDLPSAIDGSQVREEMISQMARNLARAKTPIPIDGAGVSEVHGSMYDSAAKAAGWGFAAAEVIDAEGRAHLWLWARLHADVDAQLDEGQLLYGSVAFFGSDTDRYGDGAEIGARLVSYALTNRPFVDGLEPHAPRERNQIPAGRWLAITRSRRLHMAPKKPHLTGKALEDKVRGLAKLLELTDPTHAWPRALARSIALVGQAGSADEATRGPAMEKLKELAAFLGIAEDEMTDCYGKMYDAVAALQSAANAEGVLEGMGLGAGAAPAAEEGDGARADDPPEPPAGRALLDGFESEEAQDAWTQGAREVLAAIFGSEGSGDPATLLEQLRASQDAFKGALGNAGGDNDKNPEGGDMGEKNDGARAEMIGMRAEMKKQAEEIATLRATVRRGEIDSYLDERFRAAKLVNEAGRAALTDEDRAELVEMAERAGDDWKKPIDAALRWKNAPPQGIATEPKPGDAQPGGGAPQTQRQAIDAIRAELATAHPEWDATKVRAEAALRAPKKFPELWKRSFVTKATDPAA